MSRWDVSVNDTVPETLRDRLALAVGRKVYATHHELLASERWQKVLAAGARPQRVLWASTSAKDPRTPDDLYVRCLAAPGTVNTMPDMTLDAFFDHGTLDGVLPVDGGDCDDVLASFEEAGIDVSALAARLQEDGAAAFVAAWRQLIAHVDEQLGGTP
jgi:transaldolase